MYLDVTRWLWRPVLRVEPAPLRWLAAAGAAVVTPVLWIAATLAVVVVLLLVLYDVVERWGVSRASPGDAPGDQRGDGRRRSRRADR